MIFKQCDTFQIFEFLRQKWAKWTSNCSGAIPILKMIIFCYRWRLFTIFAKRDWLFWPAWAGGVKNHIFGAFTLKVDIKQIFFKSNLFKSSTA